MCTGLRQNNSGQCFFLILNEGLGLKLLCLYVHPLWENGSLLGYGKRILQVKYKSRFHYISYWIFIYFRLWQQSEYKQQKNCKE